MMQRGEVIRSYFEVVFGLIVGFQLELIRFEKIEGFIVSEDYGIDFFENKFSVEDFVKI